MQQTDHPKAPNPVTLFLFVLLLPFAIWFFAIDQIIMGGMFGFCAFSFLRNSLYS
jgi:hypothetical protein